MEKVVFAGAASAAASGFSGAAGAEGDEEGADADPAAGPPPCCRPLLNP